MSPNKKNFYITTPIYYVNDKPHIGHAYTTVACDVLARFMSMDGYNVKFLTGTDEHGQKVEQSASLKGKTPQEFTDEISQTFRKLAADLNIIADDFIRTTEERHKEAVKYLWTTLKEKGYIYLGKYAGWYAIRDETFYKEDEIKDGKAPTGAPVQWVEEPSYFFKLSAFEDRLLRYYEEHPDFIAPKSRMNEVKRFVQGGLEDLSISRTTFSWGVPVPDDPEHIVYVWLDALTNYISALGYPEETEDFRSMWPEALHIVGKDILRFHAIFWPAFLMAADLPLPKKVYAHGWWTNEGEKISKSLGNVINPYDIIETYGLDPMRYFLIRAVPFGLDGDFSKKGMVDRLNSDLANDLGNLVQRVLSFVYKHSEAKVPNKGAFQASDKEILEDAYSIVEKVRPLISENQALHKYAEVVWQLISSANRYIDKQQPWNLRKTDVHRMETVLYTLLEVIRCLALVIKPIMPGSMDKLMDLLHIPEEDRFFRALCEQYALQEGAPLSKPEGLFPRYVEEKD